MTEIDNPFSRTTGSADFKEFVRAALEDTTWDLSGDAPTGFGLARATHLLGFLNTAINVPISRRSIFGPSKIDLVELRRRLCGVSHFSGTKPLLFEVLRDVVATLVRDWPGQTPSPTVVDTPPTSHAPEITPTTVDDPSDVAQNDQGVSLQFWNDLAASQDHVDPVPDPTLPREFPSVLLQIKRNQYTGSLSDVASLLLLEAERFGPLYSDQNGTRVSIVRAMSPSEFQGKRAEIARTFSILCNNTVPPSLPDHVLRTAVYKFLMLQLKATRERISRNTLSAPVGATSTASTSVTSSQTRVAPAQTHQPQVNITDPFSNIPAPAPAPNNLVVGQLARGFDTLVDHLQQSGVCNLGNVTGLTGVPVDQPSYIKAAIERTDPAPKVVPDLITDAMFEEDKKFLDRINWIHSDFNLDKRYFHADVEQHMQQRFCPPDVYIVGAENRGSRPQRNLVAATKKTNHIEFRRLLEVRMQRHRLQRQAIGDTLAQQEIERLKSREFLLFSTIRVRFRSMLARDDERRKALAAAMSANDCTFAQAYLGGTPAQSKAFLASVQKSRFAKRKRPRSPARAPAPAPPTKKKLACYHCGASGNNYHPWQRCSMFLAGEKPSPGSVHAKMVSQGKKLPKPKKKP